MAKNNKNKPVFTMNDLDDEMYMTADLNVKIVQSPIKNGLEFNFERQNGGITDFTLYYGGVVKLKEFMDKWLEENK